MPERDSICASEEKPGPKSGRPPVPESVRFWRLVKVGSPNECWEWLGTKNKRGYGKFGGGDSGTVRAHRMAWFLSHGQWPEASLLVCHKCDNPSCCNPSHLFIGTQSDNMQDCASKGRTGSKRSDVKQALSIRFRGSGAHTAKLKEDDVREIVRKVIRGDVINNAEVGKELGVSRSMIRLIVNKKAWKNIWEEMQK